MSMPPGRVTAREGCGHPCSTTAQLPRSPRQTGERNPRATLGRGVETSPTARGRTRPLSPAAPPRASSISSATWRSGSTPKQRRLTHVEGALGVLEAHATGQQGLEHRQDLPGRPLDVGMRSSRAGPGRGCSPALHRLRGEGVHEAGISLTPSSPWCRSRWARASPRLAVAGELKATSKADHVGHGEDLAAASRGQPVECSRGGAITVSPARRSTASIGLGRPPSPRPATPCSSSARKAPGVRPSPRQVAHTPALVRSRWRSH